MIYKVTFSIFVHTDTEEDARDIIVNNYDVDADDVEITCVGEE